MSTETLNGVTEKPAATTDQTLTEKLQSTLTHRATTPDFDLHGGLTEVLGDIGLTAADIGGKLTFYGQDPISPSPHRFGTIGALGLAAKSVAVAALWKLRTGEGQDIHVDVRKALRRFSGFFEGLFEPKWETINGRGPSMYGDRDNPFWDINFFRKTRDGRLAVAMNVYPRLHTRALNFLRCSDSPESVNNAILQWRADELESAGQEAGLAFAKIRTTEEFLKEPAYT